MPDLRGVRGEILTLHREIRLHRPIRMMHPRYPLYIVPRPATASWSARPASKATRCGPPPFAPTLELLSAAYALHPAFAEAEIVEMNRSVPAGFFRSSCPRIMPSGSAVARSTACTGTAICFRRCCGNGRRAGSATSLAPRDGGSRAAAGGIGFHTTTSPLLGGELMIIEVNGEPKNWKSRNRWPMRFSTGVIRRSHCGGAQRRICAAQSLRRDPASGRRSAGNCRADAGRLMMSESAWEIGGRSLNSRLLLGTARYPSPGGAATGDPRLRRTDRHGLAAARIGGRARRKPVLDHDQGIGRGGVAEYRRLQNRQGSGDHRGNGAGSVRDRPG
jgi:hypothetical protein